MEDEKALRIDGTSTRTATTMVEEDIDIDLSSHIHTHIKTPLRDVEMLYKQLRQKQDVRIQAETDSAVEVDALRQENLILGLLFHFELLIQIDIHNQH